LIAYINVVIVMYEEEDKILKNDFMSYFNHFINNTTLAIYNYNADKSTKDEYKRLLSSLAKDVRNILLFETKATNNIEDEIEELIEKAERVGLYVGKEQIVNTIINKEIPLIPDKYKNFIYIDYYGINLKNNSLKNKIIFFIKKYDILKELKENERKRERRGKELFNLSIKELIQLAKKYNLDLNKIKHSIAFRIEKILECLNDLDIYPGKTC